MPGVLSLGSLHLCLFYCQVFIDYEFLFKMQKRVIIAICYQLKKCILSYIQLDIFNSGITIASVSNIQK